MWRYVRPLTEEERQELASFVWSSPWRVARRGRAILLSDQGFTIAQLATIFDVDERTVRNWLDAYEAEGCKGLEDAPRSGRPRCTTPDQDSLIAQVVEKGPSILGCLLSVWTVAALSAHLVKQGIQIKSATLRRRLHELDFRWRRPRLAVMRRDPEGSVRMQRIAKKIWEATPETSILLGDETKMQHLPVLRAMWMRIARQFRIPTPEDNKHFFIFGALNILTGGWTYSFFDKQNRWSFITFLEQILLAYPVGPIILILDNARYHTAQDVMKWLAEHPRMTVLWLPRYAPELNPVDKIWWYLKQKVAANRCYLTIEHLKEAAKEFFCQMDEAQALRLASLLPEKTFA